MLTQCLTKHFSFFNNTPRVAHMTRGFLHVIPVCVIVPWHNITKYPTDMKR